MLRVLHVAPVAERGGLEAILLNILNGLDRSRVLPYVVLLEDGPFVREVEETHTEIHVISSGRVRDLFRGAMAVRRLVHLLRERRIDVVHSHNAKAHIYGSIAASIAGIPSVYHMHGVPMPAFTRDGFVSSLAVALPARETIACSHYVAGRFSETWFGSRKIRVIHNGIIPPCSAQHPEAIAVRTELGIPAASPLVLVAARLQRSKGVHVVLEAAALVLRVKPETRFAIAGGMLFGLGQGYAGELHRQAERLGLKDSVIFTGHRADVARLFAAADMVVHSSVEPDSFPTVLLEAMSFGKPVVATHLGGPPEIVIQGVTGLLVEPDRPDLLAEAILELVGSSALRVRMGQAGAERFMAEFQASRMTAQLEAIYQVATGQER